MCACRQKKSFLIEDILGDTKKKPYRNLSNEPSKPLVCSKKPEVRREEDESSRRITNGREMDNQAVDEKLTRFKVMSEVQHEIELSKVNLEQRRNTYPLYPTPVKANYPWSYRVKPGFVEPRMSFYSEQMLNNSHLLRNQLAANRLVSQIALRQAYGFDGVGPNCCSPWWGVNGRRKGGQVRFTASQTSALERRFSASKYLSPDERRALAGTLRLSDRQVKTWFQNRRAKWRRTAPETADPASPSSGDGSDGDVHIADDEL